MENAANPTFSATARKPEARGISIAMATYNGEKYISEQLESLARQSTLPSELVITDDGSSDRTIQIIEQFASGAPFQVNLFRNESRLGYADNFLKAFRLCSSQLIAFCDQDDKWFEKKIEICVREFEDPEVLLCLHSAQLLYGAGATGGYHPRFQKRRVFSPLSTYPVQGCPGFAMVICRSLLEIADNDVRPAFTATGELLGHDRWAWFLASIFGKIVVLPDVLSFYRQHENNTVGATALNLNRTISLLMLPRSYQTLAADERSFSEFLAHMAEQYSSFRHDRLNAAALQLSRRAQLNAFRAQLYAEESNVLQRIKAYGEILRRGGYLPGKVFARIGIRSGFKDFVFAVPGMHKRLWAPS